MNYNLNLKKFILYQFYLNININIESVLILVVVNLIKDVIGFSFHLFSFQIFVLIDSFLYTLEPSSFGSFLVSDGRALYFHFFDKKFILLLFELIMKFLFSSLLFL